MEVSLVLLVVAILFVARAVKVVPQQHAWVVERLGKYHATLLPGAEHPGALHRPRGLQAQPEGSPARRAEPGLHHARQHPAQVDGILYFQVTDPMRASYGSSNYITAVTQLAQTSLRSVIGKLELDKTFEERDIINAQVVRRSTRPRSTGA